MRSSNPTFGVWPKEEVALRPVVRQVQQHSPVEEQILGGVTEDAVTRAVRQKIHRIIASGKQPTWEAVIEAIARDKWLAGRATTRLVQQILREF